MISAKDVQLLNGQIENIHTEKTKAETKQEMLKKQLTEELESYKIQFGVDLQGKSISETKALIEAEVKKVTTEVEKEYNLKVKVVDAINRNDFDEAYRLLGIQVESEEPVKEQVKVEEEVKEGEETSLLEEALQGTSAESEAEEEEEMVMTMGAVEEPVKDVAEEKEGTEGMAMFMGALEEASKEITKVQHTKLKESEKNMSSMADVFGAMKVEDEKENSAFEGISDMSFGFGEALKGTKFGEE